MNRSIISIIEKLNTEMYSSGQFDDLEFIEYRSNGYVEIIQFLGQQLWSSDNNQRFYLDAKNDVREDMESFLRREVNILIKGLSTIRLANN